MRANICKSSKACGVGYKWLRPTLEDFMASTHAI